MSIPPSPEQTGKVLSLELRHFLKAESPDDFERACRLRTAVFIQEQCVPVALEMDEYDDEALHWVLIHPDTGEAVATARVLDYQEACQARPVAKIGRIAVDSSLRGQRLGDRIMREVLNYCRSAGYAQAVLDAQTRVMPFYEKLGFIREGFEFMDANIPHYRMRLVF